MTVGFRRSWFCIYVLFFVYSVFLQAGHSAYVRPKRSLNQFSNMIRVATGSEDPMRFNNYGNHCGAGSNNFYAPVVDEIDACCHQHDACYGRLSNGACYWSYSRFYSPYYNFYAWVVHNGNIICVDSDNYCKLAICNCDREVSQCFARHSFRYNDARKRSNIPVWIVENVLSQTQRVLNWFF